MMNAAAGIFLAARRKPRLPYDAEVEYLESTGEQCIPLGFYPTDNIAFTIKIHKEESGYFDCGGQESWSKNIARYVFYTIPYWQYGGSTVGAGRFPNWSSYYYGDITLTIVGNNAMIQWANRSQRVIVSGSSTPFVSQGQFVIFGVGVPGEQGYSITRNNIGTRLYSAVISDTGVSLDLQPVRYTDETGQTDGGLYDRVSGTLFKRVGSGRFIVGPDVRMGSTPVMGLHFTRPYVAAHTARDYVQDGLIAMWDGIENAGWGTHDANATTWKDLSGNGLDLTVDAGSVTWHADHVVPSTTNAANHVYRANARTEISAIGTPTTVECVFFNPSIGDFRILAALTYQGAYRAMCKGTTVAGVSGFLRSAPSGVVIQCSSSSASMLVNGVDSGDVVSTTRLSGVDRAYQDISIFGVRSLSGNVSYAIETSLYCLRVYSRDLPENERIANYAVDKARFNLPDAT